MIDISKKDVIWSYFGQFFSIASGVIILPFILRMLSSEEMGMYYLMLSIGALVSLFDFGFAPQFGRNITYVFSGAKELKKEGVEISETITTIDYRLLSTMISTARYVYRRLAIVVLILMLSFGTLYIYKVTNGFVNIKNSLLIWIIYSISTFLNVYYSYYISLLIGKGLIMESKKAMVFSKIAYILLSLVLLLLGTGLLGLTIANLIAPFVSRWISFYYFFTPEVKNKINEFNVSKTEIVELFKIIWHNAKKLGLVFVGTFAITRLSLFLAGLFLSLSFVASYGLMMQLGSVILAVSSTLFNIYQPKFSEMRVKNNNKQLMKEFAFSMNVYYIFFLFSSIVLIVFGPWLLSVIKSNTLLPKTGITVLYLMMLFLEGNHSSFATLIVTKNEVPFVTPALIAGGFIAIGSYLSLAFTTFGILGLVLVQIISQLVYNNWKWPLVVLREFNTSFFSFICLGFNETKIRLNTLIYDK